VLINLRSVDTNLTGVGAVPLFRAAAERRRRVFGGRGGRAAREETTVSLHNLTLSFHVLVAILGVGQVAAAGLVASSRSLTPAFAAPLLNTLFRTVSWSLLLLLVSGLLLDFSVAGGWHHAWWFRISFLLLLVLGFLTGQARRALRATLAPDAPSAGSQRVKSLSWTMCGVVAVITVLMVLKPW
jgi:hypothetical protein